MAGRAITLGELSSEQAAIGGGTATLAGLHNYFAATNEAVGKLWALHTTELGRALAPGEAATDERLIAGGSSLAAIRTCLSTSAEAAQGLTGRSQTALGTALAPSDLQSAERALAGGADQPAAATGAPDTAAFVGAESRLLLGMAPSAAQVSTIEQGIAAHLAKPYPGYATSATTLAAQAATAAAAAAPQFADSIMPAGPGDMEFITHIGLPRGSTIDLPFVTQNSLTPANFRFV